MKRIVALVVILMFFITGCSSKTEIDVLSYIEYTFNGVSGEATVEILQNQKFDDLVNQPSDIPSFVRNIKYEVEGAEDGSIKNGDEITIRGIYNKDVAKELNFKVVNDTTVIKVEGLKEVARNSSQLDKQELEIIKSSILDSGNNRVDSILSQKVQLSTVVGGPSSTCQDMINENLTYEEELIGYYANDNNDDLLSIVGVYKYKRTAEDGRYNTKVCKLITPDNYKEINQGYSERYTFTTEEGYIISGYSGDFEIDDKVSSDSITNNIQNGQLETVELTQIVNKIVDHFPTESDEDNESNDFDIKSWASENGYKKLDQ